MERVVVARRQTGVHARDAFMTDAVKVSRDHKADGRATRNGTR